jgi:hypothetical protein
MREGGIEEAVWYEDTDFCQLRTNKPAFYELINYYLPVVVGVRKWSRLNSTNLISDVCTVSDVAFTIHAIINNSAYWLEMAENL